MKIHKIVNGDLPKDAPYNEGISIYPENPDEEFIFSFINENKNISEKMNLEKYQTIIEKTAIYPKDIGIAYCAMGLTGEAGEVADKIKKLYRDNDYNSMTEWGRINAKEENKQAIAKELGDVLWYVTAMANEFELSLKEIMEMNYNKLIKRRETNTLQGSGDDREENI